MLSGLPSKKSPVKGKAHKGAQKKDKAKKEEMADQFMTGAVVEERLLKVNISSSPDLVALKSGGVDILFGFELDGYGQNRPFGLMPSEPEVSSEL